MKDFNWKKELKLLPGYIIVVLWVVFTAVMLGWILGASFSTSKEIFTGNVFKFETGFHWENYATAWKVQNVSIFFGNSLLYSVVSCFGVLAISAPAAYVLSRWQFTGGTPGNCHECAGYYGYYADIFSHCTMGNQGKSCVNPAVYYVTCTLYNDLSDGFLCHAFQKL